jgi:hypothetical protein
MPIMTITNDKEFKTALAALGAAERRQVATRLVRQVLDLSPDPRVKGALDLAGRTDAGVAELSVAAAGVNTARVESYTQCGHDTNWSTQASHFVARAAQECVKPLVDLAAVWEAAMQARMARICQTLAAGEGTGTDEAEAQYRALETFLQLKESAS